MQTHDSDPWVRPHESKFRAINYSELGVL